MVSVNYKTSGQVFSNRPTGLLRVAQRLLITTIGIWLFFLLVNEGHSWKYVAYPGSVRYGRPPT